MTELITIGHKEYRQTVKEATEDPELRRLLMQTLANASMNACGDVPDPALLETAINETLCWFTEHPPSCGYVNRTLLRQYAKRRLWNALRQAYPVRDAISHTVDKDDYVVLAETGTIPPAVEGGTLAQQGFNPMLEQIEDPWMDQVDMRMDLEKAFACQCLTEEERLEAVCVLHWGMTYREVQEYLRERGKNKSLGQIFNDINYAREQLKRRLTGYEEAYAKTTKMEPEGRDADLAAAA